MFRAFMEESKAQMLHQKDHHRFMLIAVLFKYFEWLRVVQISAEGHGANEHGF